MRDSKHMRATKYATCPAEAFDILNDRSRYTYSPRVTTAVPVSSTPSSLVSLTEAPVGLNDVTVPVLPLLPLSMSAWSIVYVPVHVMIGSCGHSSAEGKRTQPGGRHTESQAALQHMIQDLLLV